MNKRAASLDNMYVLISFFVLVLFALIGQLVWNTFTEPAMDEDLWEKTTVGTNSRDHAQKFYDNLDNIVLMVYIALHLGVLVMAYSLRTHPVVYVASIFIIIILAIIGAVFANAYEEIITDKSFENVYSTMPKTNFLMEHYPKFEVIWGFVTAIVLFGLAKSEGFI